MSQLTPPFSPALKKKSTKLNILFVIHLLHAYLIHFSSV